MKFCRICGTELDSDARFCDRCGSVVSDSTVQSTSRCASNWISTFWNKSSRIILLIALIVIVLSFLTQFELTTDATKTIFTDEYYRKVILSMLREHPTAYYSIVDIVYRQMFSAGGVLFSNDFPLLLYLWLLAPTLADIKWLYLPFALAGVVGSYIAIYAVTGRNILAFLSGIWIAFYLETFHYLMYEPWAVSIFLVGLAFFLMRRHVLAATTIGVATLMKEVFAPFLLFASLYYLLISRHDWWPVIVNVFASGQRDAARQIKTMRAQPIKGWSEMKLAAVWITATFLTGLLWYVNGLVSTGGDIHFSHSPFTTNKPELRLSALPLLFAGCCSQNALPFPTIIAVTLGLVAIFCLKQDQSIILYASFAFLPIMILLGVVGFGGTGDYYRGDNVPRWTAMSIAMVNLFWPAGIYKICEFIYKKLT